VARLRQIVPVQANLSETPDAINGGIYAWNIDIVGLGFAYTFDRPVPPGSPAVPDREVPDREVPDREEQDEDAPREE
jgi:hypothetical protein